MTREEEEWLEASQHPSYWSAPMTDPAPILPHIVITGQLAKTIVAAIDDEGDR